MIGFILIGLQLQENIQTEMTPDRKFPWLTPSYGIVDLNASYDLPMEFNGINSVCYIKC